MNLAALLYAILAGTLSLVGAHLLVGRLISMMAKTAFGARIIREINRNIVREFWKQGLLVVTVVSLVGLLFGWSVLTVAIICAVLGGLVPIALLSAGS